jgi:hypothetical protein
MAKKLLTAKEFGARLHPAISARRVAMLCQMDKIPEAQKIGKTWVIPDDAKDPRDMRFVK